MDGLHQKRLALKIILSELEELEFPIKEFKDAAGRKVKEYM